MPKQIKKNKNSMQTAFTRFMLIVALFILWIGGISLRLVHLQVNQSDWLRGRALNQRRDQVKSRLLRGTIYDRSERALAMSVQTKSLYADPLEIDDVEKTAKEVAAVLRVKPNDILKDLREAKESGKRFVWLARQLDGDTAQKINETLEDTELKKADKPRFAGLHWREEQKRSYPNKTLAAQVVGFSNADDVGQAGIEQSQEEILRGAVIKGWQDRDRLGRVYEESETETREPPKDIVLTISNSIQYKTEQSLEKGVKAANAKSGIAIVLDPKTGEILAMANYPTFDPNNFREFETENYKNKAVQGSFAPGSVFKLITYGAALQENLIKPDASFGCGNGIIKVGSRAFADKHCGGSISYIKAMAISSNYGAISTGLKIGKNRFSSYIHQFGFGETTGIELPAETRGLVRPLASWQGDSLPSLSIGYEIGVTALQIASAFAVVANHGVKVQPHIIKEIRQADGKVISKTEPEKKQIISAEAADGLRRMLREVVLTGTGKEAALDGYTSAGKTGTAWKYDPKIKRVSGSKYTSSFVGFAPADNPSVIIAVILDEPQGALRNGGQVSAPIFRQIAEQILPELNVVPDISIRPDNLTAEDIPSESEIAPTLTEKITKSEKTKEPKKANKPPSEDKKLTKQKTAVLTDETKNKSSRERTKQKT